MGYLHANKLFDTLNYHDRPELADLDSEAAYVVRQNRNKTIQQSGAASPEPAPASGPKEPWRMTLDELRPVLFDEMKIPFDADRFEVGQVTRTDVAQSQSRLAVARGELRNAQANLITARETYIQLVGDAPDDLQPPPPLPNLPADVGTFVL